MEEILIRNVMPFLLGLFILLMSYSKMKWATEPEKKDRSLRSVLGDIWKIDNFLSSILGLAIGIALMTFGVYRLTELF